MSSTDKTPDTTSDRQDAPHIPRGGFGDARPDSAKDDTTANPGQPAEAIEDRPSVGVVTPEDYPDKDRASSDATGTR